MKDIIARLVDNSDFEEYKEGYGQTIICGYARMDGWAVGIVANQREMIKTKKGEMQFGGVIYSIQQINQLVLLPIATKRKYHWYFYRMLLVLWWGHAPNMVVLLKMAPKW